MLIPAVLQKLPWHIDTTVHAQWSNSSPFLPPSAEHKKACAGFT